MIRLNVQQDGIEDLVDEILDAANGYGEVNAELAQLASEIRRDLLTGDFVDRSGELRRSMQVIIQDHTLTISMAFYGYFLSFGTSNADKKPLTQEVASAFRGKDVGSFFNQPDNNSGIRARNFYPTNIQQRIAERLEAIATDI
jgi:hypothetical protein